MYKRFIRSLESRLYFDFPLGCLPASSLPHLLTEFCNLALWSSFMVLGKWMCSRARPSSCKNNTSEFDQRSSINGGSRALRPQGRSLTPVVSCPEVNDWSQYRAFGKAPQLRECKLLTRNLWARALMVAVEIGRLKAGEPYVQFLGSWGAGLSA